jgi:DNA-binding transcriptional regulator of glucitol operon
MLEKDFPGLYQAADLLSKKSQKNFFRALGAHLVLLVIAAALSVASSPYWWVAYSQVIVLLGALFCSIYLFSKRPDRLWYSGRAVAESIKTVTWRYITKAEPFFVDDTKANLILQSKISEVITQNRNVADKLITHLETPPISDEMRRLRSQLLVQRKQNYVDNRIKDQLSWYAKKAQFNSSASWWAFTILVVINAFAVMIGVAKVAYPTVSYWPTDIFIASAASLLGWMQAKRFSELSASYTLTAHEIGIIGEQSHQEMEDEQFSLFVGDAENAFSREHTQWVARKDN